MVWNGLSWVCTSDLQLTLLVFYQLSCQVHLIQEQAHHYWGITESGFFNLTSDTLTTQYQQLHATIIMIIILSFIGCLYFIYAYGIANSCKKLLSSLSSCVILLHVRSYKLQDTLKHRIEVCMKRNFEHPGFDYS